MYEGVNLSRAEKERLEDSYVESAVRIADMACAEADPCLISDEIVRFIQIGRKLHQSNYVLEPLRASVNSGKLIVAGLCGGCLTNRRSHRASPDSPCEECQKVAVHILDEARNFYDS